MKEKPNGGPAFPSRRDVAYPSGGSYRDDRPGMTLRDYFAAKAMQGILSNGDVIDQFNDKSIEWAVENSIKLADAMIKARGEA